MRKPSKSDPLICKIDMTPFAAIMLVMLLFFVSGMIFPNDSRYWAGVGVNVPDAANSVALPDPDEPPAIVISITREGGVYVERFFTPPVLLRRELHGMMTYSPQRKVFIAVDRRAKYAVVLMVLDCVRAAGGEKVAFLTDPRSRVRHHLR